MRKSLVLTGAAAVPAALAYAIRGRSASLLAPSVWRGSPHRRDIALTFDDGPTPGTTRILELLAKYGAPATFFQCGAQVRRLPALAREVAAAGHELGNHTYTHSMMLLQSFRTMEDEIRQTQEAIALETGYLPRYFRPPYGVRGLGLGAIQRKFDLLGVMWSVIGRDWRLPAEAIERRLLRMVHNGAILCLHDGRELSAEPDIQPTIEAVRRVLPVLIDRGFRFQTVTRLLCPTN